MALRARLFFCVIIFGLVLAGAEQDEWITYGRDPGGQRFSPLTQIDKSNVASLKVAWTFRTGDLYNPEHGRPPAFEATPLYLDGTLYVATPLGRVIALDPIKGTQLWAFDSHIPKDAGYGDYATRGVSTWKPDDGPRRIYIATIDARLIALDSATGKPVLDFADNGTINLRTGLRIPPSPNYFADYEETSAPAVVGRTIVVGSGVADNGSVNQPSGEVRGFDAKTGKLMWSWDPIPQDPNALGADTWKNGSAARTGAANAWSTIAVDSARNLIFVPTGSASPDFYGGERLGDNLFANSVVALNAQTGKMVWHFQTVHHDLWDYDVATSPLLFEMKRDGKTIPAIAIGSKTGNVFILNRETGVPIFGVEERPVAKSDVPGEMASPTQPFPLKPAPLTPQRMTVDDAWGPDEASKQWCRDEIGKLRTGDIFTPPSLGGSLLLPGNIGGMNWGGFAYDPGHDLLVAPSNHIASEVRLIPRADYDDTKNSKGRKLDGDWEFAPQRGTPYGMMRRFLLSPKHLPCTPPPWGALIAIQTSTGEKKWETPLGRLSAKLPSAWGSISLGGPFITAGGLVFVAGTLDPAIYAFDVETGRQLWRGDLPTSARSTPMTYRGPDGRQYVVISAGSHQPAGDQPLGDYVVAFKLLDSRKTGAASRAP
jgi:quinoprotein glucose dehydrogenase